MDLTLNTTCFDFAAMLALKGNIGWGDMPPMDDYFRRQILGEGEDLEAWSRCHLAAGGEGADPGVDSFAMPIAFREGEQFMLSLGGLARARHQAGLVGSQAIFDAADYLLSLAAGQQHCFEQEAGALTFSAEDDGWWVEIFKAGTWTASNGFTRTYTREDLAAAVESFDALGEILSVPLRIGDHAPDPDADTKMAYGLVSKLKVEDDVLLAFFSHVPDDVKDAIRDLRYLAVSAGLWFDWKYDGQTYPIVLNHVALLGALQPAVKGLARPDAHMGDGEVQVYTFTASTKGDEMELKEALEKIATLEADLSTKNTELEAVTKDRDELKATVADHQEKALEAKVRAVVDKAHSEQRLRKDDMEGAFTVGMTLAKAADFSEGGDHSAFDAWERGVVGAEKIVDLSRKAASGGGDERRVGNFADDMESARQDLKKLSEG